MSIRKILLAACAAALTTTPAWALPGGAPSNDGTAHAPATTPAGPPVTTPANGDNPGSDERQAHAQQPQQPSGAAADGQSGDDHGQAGSEHGRSHGQSHRCTARKVGYVAAGTLTDQTLTLDAGSSPATASGDATIDVKRTNRHARADRGSSKTYTLDHARLVLGLDDQNGDGTVDLADVVAGSRARVIGSVTVLPRRCDQSGFTAQVTIRRLIVHAPLPTS